jgi:hypothetical protein
MSGRKGFEGAKRGAGSGWLENMGVRMAINVARAMAIAAFAASPSVSSADDLQSPVASRAFLFGGADVSQSSGFVWTGMTAIPFGHIGEDGLRLRFMGGTGQYKYNTSAVPSGKNKGTITSGELLVGYRTSFGATVINGFIGLDAKNYSLDEPDPGNRETGSHAGVKAAVELYTRTAPDWFVTGYGNISSVFQNYSAKTAINHEFVPGFALGAEGGVLGDKRYDEERAGLVATVTLTKTIFTVASGVAHSSDNGNGTYMTLTLYTPF